MQNIEIISQGGIKCDNPKCDYADNTVVTDKTWIGRPCPKCGENLLTEEDYFSHQALMLSIDYINSLSPEELEKLNNSINHEGPVFGVDLGGLDAEKSAIFTIDTHKGVNITSVILSDPNSQS